MRGARRARSARAASRSRRTRPARRSGSIATSASPRTSRRTRRTSRPRSRGPRARRRRAARSARAATRAATSTWLRARRTSAAGCGIRRRPSSRPSGRPSPTTPTAVHAVIDEPRFVGDVRSDRSGEKLKRVPSGFPKDHPEAELLKHKDLTFGHRLVRRRRQLARPARHHRRLVRGRGSGHALARLALRPAVAADTDPQPRAIRARRYNRHDTDRPHRGSPQAGRPQPRPGGPSR